MSEIRIDWRNVSHDGFRAMISLERYIHTSSLEPLLIELIKTRASQINGCAHCLEMHTKDALALGESDQRLFLLSAWRETPLYSDRERAALAWTEAVTQLSTTKISDALFADVQLHFSEKEIADLTLAIVAINGWNRLAVSLHSEVGNYVSPHSTPK